MHAIGFSLIKNIAVVVDSVKTHIMRQFELFFCFSYRTRCKVNGLKRDYSQWQDALK